MFIAAAAAQGELNIYADSLVTVMLRRHKTVLAGGAKEVPGFRIQVIQSPDRALAMRRKGEFLAAFPDLRTDYSYSDPYHKLKAGAFPNRDECQKWMTENSIKTRFPEAIPVYEDKVSVKDLMKYLGIEEEQ